MIINADINTSVQYWKGERFIIKKQMRDLRDMCLFWSNLQGSSSNPIAKYWGYYDGAVDEVLIDVTDYVRANAGVHYLYVQEEGEQPVTITVSVAGLINPAGVIIPPHDLEAYNALILPPTKILINGTQGDPTNFELYTTAGSWSVSGDAVMSANERIIRQISGDFTLTDGTHEKRYTPQLLNPCSRYALVKWVSFSGIERTAWYEVKREKSAVVDPYELLPINNEYVEIKGREDGFVIWLDGLDAYDLWYYADPALSSKLEISLDGGQTFDRVQVTTKEVETPDFANDGKVELAVNWKRYDAVAM